MGPFPEALGRVKFLIIVVDYFSKWVEAEEMVVISRKKCGKVRMEEDSFFLWSTTHDYQ